MLARLRGLPWAAGARMARSLPRWEQSPAAGIASVASELNSGARRAVRDVKRVFILRKVSFFEELHALMDQGRVASTPLAVRSLEDEHWVDIQQENMESINAVAEFLCKQGVDVRLEKNVCADDGRWADLVVSVGGDGTFLRAAQALEDGDRTPVLGVNSAPSSSFGQFCCSSAATFPSVFEKYLQGEMEICELWRIRVLVNKLAYPTLALNDALFAADTAASTARYTITCDSVTQKQKSSGVWIATAAGSTAAILSAGGTIRPINERALQYRVRELFVPSVAESNGKLLVGGMCAPDFHLISRMPHGRVYLDGHRSYVNVEFGDVVQFLCSDFPLSWVKPERWERIPSSSSVAAEDVLRLSLSSSQHSPVS